MSSLSHSSNSYVLQIHLFSFFYFCWFYTDAAAFAATNYSKQKEKWKFRLLWQPFADSYFIIIVYVCINCSSTISANDKHSKYPKDDSIYEYIYIFMCVKLFRKVECVAYRPLLSPLSLHIYEQQCMCCVCDFSRTMNCLVKLLKSKTFCLSVTLEKR